MVKRLLGYLAARRYKTVALVLTMLATTAVEILIAWPLAIVVSLFEDKPFFGFSFEGYSVALVLVVVSTSYVVFAAMRGLLNYFRRRWLEEISQSGSLAMRDDLYAQVQRLSLRFHDRSRVGDVVTRITADVDKLQAAFVNIVSIFAVDILSVFGIAVVMFFVDWRFALVALLVLPPLLLIYVVFRERVKVASRQVRANEGAMASLAQETLSSIRVVKSFGGEDREHERFLDRTRLRAEASVRAASSEGSFSFWVEIVTAAGIALVLGYGGWRIANGGLSLGVLVLFVQYLNNLYSPLRRLSRLINVIQRAAASAERIEELFALAPEVEESKNAVPLKKGPVDIVFEDVYFGYDPDRPVLRGVNLEVKAGESIAVVGHTGVGKSTLISLIPRLYDATQGRILIGGVDVRDLELRSLRESVSVVLQDPILFSGTVRDNIAYSRPEATDEEVEASARAAHAHDFILGLPEGYDSPVGERGVTLSGGQRQRIAIARALLKDAPILILDEPTSAVDAGSEGLIREALQRLMKGRSVVVITHRPSTTELAERVVVLEDGVVVEEGPLEEMREGGRLFRRLLAT